MSRTQQNALFIAEMESARREDLIGLFISTVGQILGTK
jgi:hypothetical protein